MKCSPDYNVVTFDKVLDLQSIDQVMGSAEPPAAPDWVFIKHAAGNRREITECSQRLRVNNWAVNARDNGYRVGHCMIGTVLIAFAGEPLTIFVLIAR